MTMANFLRRLRPRRLKTKLFITVTIFIAIVSITFTWINAYEQIQAYRQKSAEGAQLLATLLSNVVRLPLFAENIPLLETYAREAAAYPGVQRVVIFNASGKPVVDFKKNQLINTSLISRTAKVTLGQMSNAEVAFLGSVDADRHFGLVQVDMSNQTQTAAIRKVIISSSMTAIVSWLLITALSFKILSWVTRSLDPLTSGIRSIRGGDYSYRIDMKNHDDLGEAALEVNELAEELQRREADNKRLQKELIDAMKNEVREERRSMMAKLIQTNRMTSLGLLVSSMAHEINTPNGAIKLASTQVAKMWKDVVPILDQVNEEEGEILLAGIEYNLVRGEIGKALDLIVRSSGRIDTVVNDLRAYSTGDRKENSNNVNVNQVVTDALTIVRAHGRYRNLQIKSSLAENLPSVLGSKYQLEQVVTNLILNAMQALSSTSEGLVTIATEHDDNQHCVRIIVEDNGEGISDLVMANLMEPFFSTRMDKGGSGLGLYISNYIVNEHGGELQFETEVGVGTRVVVNLPA
jgi:signal transduction histidine kinase